MIAIKIIPVIIVLQSEFYYEWGRFAIHARKLEIA